MIGASADQPFLVAGEPLLGFQEVIRFETQTSIQSTPHSTPSRTYNNVDESVGPFAVYLICPLMTSLEHMTIWKIWLARSGLISCS